MRRSFLYSLFVIPLLLAACQQEQGMQEPTNEGKPIEVKDSDPQPKQKLSNNEIANHLATIASEVPNVKDATSVIAGPYAVVGIDVDKDLDRSRVGTIKYSVVEALHDDPYGKTAVVIADADGTQRIKQMADKIQQGHPIQGVVDELSAVVGRYMPDFPINEDQPKEPDQNKNVIPKDEKEKLEEIEEDQSNNKKNNG